MCEGADPGGGPSAEEPRPVLVTRVHSPKASLGQTLAGQERREGAAPVSRWLPGGLWLASRLLASPW